MRKGGIGMAFMALLCAGAGTQSKQQKKPAPAIKEIMLRTHDGKDNLASEVRNGFGKKEDHQKLLAEYQTLAGLKPPMGDEKSWKAKTGAVIAALTDLVAEKDGALGRVHAVTDCKGCHDAHRVGGNSRKK